MKNLIRVATAVVSLSFIGAAAAKADTVLKYVFSPGTYYNFSGGTNSVSGSFLYDVDTGAVTSVDYTRGSDHFTTGSLYSSPSEIYFGLFGTSDYDVYQLTQSLALGGTDTILSGTHPAITIDAGGALTAASGTPEPASWAMMLVGFGLIGAAARSGKSRVSIRHA